MSDFNTPVLGTAYATFLSNLKDRDVSAITLCQADPSNIPQYAMKWNRSTLVFQEYNNASATAWANVVLDIAGGGTAASTTASARTNLGLGDMATQSSTAVSITGGSLGGNGSAITNLSASALATGTAPTARLGSGSATAITFLRGDSSWASVPLNLSGATAATASFTASVETVYALSHTGNPTVTLPSVAGNGGKRILFANRSTGHWNFTAASGETISGSSVYDFNFGQYSSIMLIADANNALWDIF
jgi:hypothetical protein